MSIVSLDEESLLAPEDPDNCSSACAEFAFYSTGCGNKTVLKKSKVENFQRCLLTNCWLALNRMKIMIGLLPPKLNDPCGLSPYSVPCTLDGKQQFEWKHLKRF